LKGNYHPGSIILNMKPRYIKTEDGIRLAVWQVGDGGATPVVLTHGTFSNHMSCVGLAEHLASKGFQSWIFDWRGHGASDRPLRPYTFDCVAVNDVTPIVDSILDWTGQSSLFWVGHSGGGLVISMWMSLFPELASTCVKGLALMAAQATSAADDVRHRIAIAAIDCFLRFRRTAPGHHLGIGPEPESAPLMRQWCRWNLRKSFTSNIGFDYLNGLAKVDKPVLALSGAGDRFIAPIAGCRILLNAFGGNDRSFVICGREHGFAEDYSHDGIVLSKNARRELWPLISKWLISRL